MCLGVPAQVVSIEESKAKVRVGTVFTAADLSLTPEAAIGDFVMLHAGFALKVMEKSAVEAALATFSEIESERERLGALVDEIAALARGLGPVTVMEVCGTHTVAIARNGLRAKLPPNVRLVSGPGCPVCVTPTGEIDMAIELALSGRARIVTFGDMLRVPGSGSTLEAARSEGAKVDVVYSPSSALALAGEAGEEIVFLAVGFETTAPVIAAAVKEAASRGLTNFSVIAGHRLIPPALEVLLSDPDSRIDALICPGHVSTVIGASAYVELAERFKLPFVVAGFEAGDVLEAVAMILAQIKDGRPGVGNQYVRSVTFDGSPNAKKEMLEVFEATAGRWRGLGDIPDSRLGLSPAYRGFDAVEKFGLRYNQAPEPPGCRCGSILSGKLVPGDCGLFGRTCRPESPVGPCMVSSEGACHAVYLYG